MTHDYLRNKRKDIPPLRISCCFTPHTHRSWAHAARVSHPVMGNTPLKEKKTTKIIFFPQILIYILLKALESLDRLTTIDFYPHNRCGIKKRKQDYKIKRKYIWLDKIKIKTPTQRKQKKADLTSPSEVLLEFYVTNWIIQHMRTIRPPMLHAPQCWAVKKYVQKTCSINKNV